MYLAMNHFRVAPDRADEFEAIWRERDTFLDEVPGFRSFHMLRGPREEPGEDGKAAAVLYASHTVWESEEAFLAWTQSEAFRKAHAQGRLPAGVIAGPPKLYGWTAFLSK